MDNEISISQDHEMRLGKMEFLAMNNSVRRAIQKHVEFKIFRELLHRHNINLKNKVILDGGCGSGFSTKLITEEFNPEKIIAFDYMPEQIERAQKKYKEISFFTGKLKTLIIVY